MPSQSSAPSTLAILVLLAIVVVSALSGCFTTSQIRPTDLASLDGYETGQPARAERPLQTLDGGNVTFRRASRLALDLPDQRVGGHFTSISVHEGRFEGRTSDGRTVAAPVDQIRSANVSEHNVGGTVALVGLAALVLITGVYLATVDRSMSVSGRALRIDGRAVVAPPSASEGWRGRAATPDVARLSADARQALAEYWKESARAEHASVPAFARLSLTLMAHGAPARLVEAAHRAALEEVEHARLTFELAGAYANGPVAPGPLVELVGAPAVTAASLEALAAESLVDGCFLEGVAAAAAEAALGRARDPAVREALTVIARDERSHTELAWQIVAWCCAEGGPTLRRAVCQLAGRLPAPAGPRDAAATLHAELSAHGWLAPAAWREIGRRTRLDVGARALVLFSITPEDANLRLV